MPFVQMENISHFLRACQSPPLNLQQHDTFLTVDLFEQKDPAQVLQCLSAFSRAANAANPGTFPAVIGGAKLRSGALTPQPTGPPKTPTGTRGRGGSVTSNNSSTYGVNRPVAYNRTGDSTSGKRSPAKSPTSDSVSPGPVSTWAKKEHEGVTAPAWNIAQYGYIGGASQGNLGISFGGRRQITTSGPQVPSLADKERRRKEREAEEARQRKEAEAEERRKKAEEQAAEERRWQAETQRLREQERLKAEEEKRKWQEEERQWKLTEEKRRKDEEAAEARLDEERRSTRSHSDARLRGQFLSQYQAEQAAAAPAEDDYRNRVKELEKELELARQREAEYERERQGRDPQAKSEAKARARSKARSRSRPAAASPPSRQDSWSRGDREVLRTKWTEHQQHQQELEATSSPPSVKSPRPLPDPTTTSPRVSTPTSSRPLPNPATYSSPPSKNRTDRYLASNAPPVQASPRQTYSRELGATAERDAEDQRRAQSQNKTIAGGWASKSLLEREMEMERQRQKEWESSQKETAAAVRGSNGVDGVGGGIGGRWDVSQWSGFTGGDSQNKGSQGIGASRRPMVGPRPLPDTPR